MITRRLLTKEITMNEDWTGSPAVTEAEVIAGAAPAGPQAAPTSCLRGASVVSGS